jgi:hypothetical protein
MAKLDRRVRDQIAGILKGRLPSNWKVVHGSKGFAFIEVDQDGNHPPHTFPAIGSTVISIENVEGNRVAAIAYRRVPFPDGYCEGRKEDAVLCLVSGRGWVDEVIDAVVGHALKVISKGTTAADA